MTIKWTQDDCFVIINQQNCDGGKTCLFEIQIEVFKVWSAKTRFTYYMNFLKHIF